MKGVTTVAKKLVISSIDGIGYRALSNISDYGIGTLENVANGANSDSQLQYVRTGDNAGAFHFKARNAGSTYPNLMTIKSDGSVGINRVDPDLRLNVSGNIELNAHDNTSGGGGYYTSKGLIIGNAYDAGKASSVTDLSLIHI